MTKRITILALLVAFISVDASAQSRTYRRRGVLLGGLAGAAIGAAIGDKGNNETAGALIGGAVGTVAGGTIGNQKDQRIDHNRRYHSGYHNHVQPQGPYAYGPYPQYGQPYASPQLSVYPQQPIVVPSPPTPRPISPDEVVEMTQSGMSETLIVEQIRIQGVQQQLTVSDVIRLHQLGVSEPVINEMQRMAVLANSPEAVAAPGQSYRIPIEPQESLARVSSRHAMGASVASW